MCSIALRDVESSLMSLLSSWFQFMQTFYDHRSKKLDRFITINLVQSLVNCPSFWISRRTYGWMIPGFHGFRSLLKYRVPVYPSASSIKSFIASTRIAFISFHCVRFSIQTYSWPFQISNLCLKVKLSKTEKSFFSQLLCMQMLICVHSCDYNFLCKW